MINKKALTSGQLSEVGSTEGLTVDLTDARKTDELLAALGCESEISLSGYSEIVRVRFANPKEVNVGTVLDRYSYVIGMGDGRAEVWLGKHETIHSFSCSNADVSYANGTLTIREHDANIDDRDEENAPSIVAD